MFIKTSVIIMDETGSIERRAGEVPAVVGHPRLKVSTPSGADERETARLLHRMADELEARP